MTFKRTTKLRNYAVHITTVCHSLPTVESLVRQLRSPATGFGNHRLTFPVACTHNSASDAQKLCQIFEELNLWNEILSHVKLELREVTPGRLAVARIDRIWVPQNKLQEVRRAVICLHWLLSEHRCVDSVEVDSVVLEYYPQLFCDAIKRSTSVKVVRLCGQGKLISTTPEVFRAIFQACSLEELHCDFIHLTEGAKELQSMLAAYIKKVAILGTLSLTRISPGFETEALVKALKANSTITSLTIQLRDLDTRSLAAFLANNSVLTDLTVGSITATSITGLLPPVFQALEGNTSLRKLSLHNFDLDVVDGTQLSDMLAVNTAIEDLSFCSCTWTNFPPCWLYGCCETQAKFQAAKARWGSGWHVDTLAQAIRNSSSLRRLRFDKNHFHSEELLRLLQAVNESSVFQQLCFEIIFCHSIAEIADAVLQTRTAGKFFATECISSSSYFANSVSRIASSPSATLYSFYDLMPVQLEEICTALTANDHVSALNLRMTASNAKVDEYCAALLAAYLSSTTALKDLRMRFQATGDTARIVLQGLCSNNTIEKLTLTDLFLNSSEVRDICAWVQKRRTLYHFVCVCEYYGNGEEVLIEQLLDILQTNHTLTFSRVDDYIENDSNWQVMSQLLGRNLTYVIRAAEFALGSTLKRCAIAFELVFWHPLVRSRLEDACAGNAEAAQKKIRDGLRRLDTDFWKLTGVVNEDFSCYPSNENRTQIDNLGFDAWTEIRKLLSVADVSCD